MKKTFPSILTMTCLASGSVYSQNWLGTTDQDWSNPANWTPANVPGVNSQAVVNVATGNFPIITTAETKTATFGGNDLWIGRDSGNTGRLDINSGGSLNTSGTWVFVGHFGGDGALNVNSGGSLISDNQIRLGASRLGASEDSTGVLNINGGTVSVGGMDESTGNANVNVTAGGTLTSTAANIRLRGGTSSIDSGAISSAGEIFTNNGATFNVSGGEVNSGSWFVVGTGDDSSGTVNLSEGTINAAQTDGRTTIGAFGATGTVNQTGGIFNAGGESMFLGETGGGTGNYNLNGGALALTSGTLEVGDGSGNFNFGGGTLDLSATAGVLTKAGAGNLTVTGAGSAPTLSIAAGGLFITDSMDTQLGITVASGAVIGSADSAASITGGLLFQEGAFLDITNGVLTMDSGTLSFENFGFDDIIAFDVNSAADGVYTLVDGTFTLDSAGLENFGQENALALGDGRGAWFEEGSLLVKVGVIPEPSIAILSSMGMLALLRRRR